MRVAAARRERKTQRPTLAEVESEYIRETLTATKGNKTEAARILGISRKNLYERLAREQKSEVRSQRPENAVVTDQRSDLTKEDRSDL